MKSECTQIRAPVPLGVSGMVVLWVPGAILFKLFRVLPSQLGSQVDISALWAQMGLSGTRIPKTAAKEALKIRFSFVRSFHVASDSVMTRQNQRALTRTHNQSRHYATPQGNWKLLFVQQSLHFLTFSQTGQPEEGREDSRGKKGPVSSGFSYTWVGQFGSDVSTIVFLQA